MRSGRTPLRSNGNNNPDYNSERSGNAGMKVSTESGAGSNYMYKASSKGSSRADQSKTMEYSVAVPASNGKVQNNHEGVSIELERY